MMNVPVKSSNGITMVPLESRLITKRKIFIRDEINANTACDFIEKIMYLNDEDCEKPIDVFINSIGGEINSGMMMYDAIQLSKAPVRMFCVGRAYSMGAVLFACGTHGRYMLPNSELMLHEPLLGNSVGGNASSIRSISDSLLEAKHKMNQILARHTGRTVEEVEKATGYDHYFSPEESIDFGLCDKVMDRTVMMEV